MAELAKIECILTNYTIYAIIVLTMPPRFEIPTKEALIAEQAKVQAEKHQGRLLREYNYLMFPGQSYREPKGSAVADFVRPLISNAERATLESVLEGMIEAKAGAPVNWVDMGGGRALAMRQLGNMPDFKHRVNMTNVDLFNYGLEGLEPHELEFLEGMSPGMTHPNTEPLLVTDTVETVQLPEPADVITSVEAIQYLNNPLEAMANWYNQLADNGIMIIATEHDWASWIRYNEDFGSRAWDEVPVKHVTEALAEAGIKYAVTEEEDWESGHRPKVDPNRIRIMAVQKKPGTSLRVTKPVTKLWVNPDNYKAVYYEAPDDEASPIVEVVKTGVAASLGAVSLRNDK